MKGWLALLVAATLAFSGCIKSPASDGAAPSPSESSTGTSTGPSGSSSSSSTSATGTPDPNPGPGTVPTNATPRIWAQPDQAAIRPGASIDDGNCTGNFIFTSLDNATVYIGTAAHCYSTSGNTETDGCQVDLKPLGTKSKVQGATEKAVLVYSSWSAMQAAGTAGPACNNNDFALLQLNASDAAKVNPAMREFGGPTALAAAGDVQSLDKVLSYGNSGSRPEDSVLSPREGYVTLPASGCASRVVFPNPAIPGDSGSPVILADGLAFGVFVSIELTPIPGQGHVCLLEDLLTRAAAAGFVVQLATWPVLDSGILPAL